MEPFQRFYQQELFYSIKVKFYQFQNVILALEARIIMYFMLSRTYCRDVFINESNTQNVLFFISV